MSEEGCDSLCAILQRLYSQGQRDCLSLVRIEVLVVGCNRGAHALVLLARVSHSLSCSTPRVLLVWQGVRGISVLDSLDVLNIFLPEQPGPKSLSPGVCVALL